MKLFMGLLMVMFQYTSLLQAEDSNTTLNNLQVFANSNGSASTFVVGVEPTAPVNTAVAFFRNFGTNKRTCFSCHTPGTGWTVTPEYAQKAFDTTQGLDPLFRTVDGSNAPELDVSTLDAKRKAYSMLLTRGTIRVGLPIPANAEFSLDAVDDPYHHASSADLSLFRRPLPSQNLKFLSDVMWDGRETIEHGDLDTELGTQANDATKTHAQTIEDLEPDDESEMVQFEESLLFGQTSTIAAGLLNANGAVGGPQAIANFSFYIGINDPLGHDPKGIAFTPNVFSLFQSWRDGSQPTLTEGQKAVGRGENIFNSRTFAISGVAGLNDIALKPTIQGTCTTCHNTPNAGGNSSSMRMNLGLTDESQRTADLPLYTLKNLTTGAVVKTTDPGRALISGKWNDIGAFKVPTLRGLTARAPYFHNGSAKTLDEALSYLDTRFQIGLTTAERSDLEAFLSAL